MRGGIEREIQSGGGRRRRQRDLIWKVLNIFMVGYLIKL